MSLNRMRPAVTSLVLLMAATTAAQNRGVLPRRGYFGVGLEQGEAGVRVFSVAAGSTAEAARILVGDVIEAIDRRSVETPEAVVGAIGDRRGGDAISVSFLRDGTTRTVDVVLKEFPREQMRNATVQYSSVEAPTGVRLRTIISTPETPSGDRFPAVLLVQGGGCGSIDTPIGPPTAQPELMHGIGSQGFVTMRVEKSGVGDSEGPPCDSIGFEEEFAGYQAALAALRTLPAVDPERIYLLGISLGGVFAPLLAAETRVAGIIVWGTASQPPPPYPGRSQRFFDEFAPIDVAEAWSKVNTRVLVLHGEYDVGEYVSRASHERIAGIVNASDGGSAEFREFPGLDHCWTSHPSLEASRDKCGNGRPSTAFLDSILDFLRAAAETSEG